jgi:glycosyltransferase involved in cell wall biosynthesis
MHFVIVTPCWNAEDFIGDTVRSIVRQTALARPGTTLTYIVADGGSTDSTLDIVRKLWRETPSANLRIISEPDSGMYDALAKAFALDVRGDVYAYLNAGDMYSPTCWDVIEYCFTQLNVAWLTGMRVKYNESGTVFEAFTPYPYSRQLITGGYYGIRRGAGSFIQQESTFWNRALMERIDLDVLKTFRLAGDFYLWKTFAEVVDLAVVGAHLGGFRVHQGQLSEAMGSYRLEARRVITGSVAFGRTRILFRELRSLLPTDRRGPLSVTRSGPFIGWSSTHGRWYRRGTHPCRQLFGREV